MQLTKYLYHIKNILIWKKQQQTNKYHYCILGQREGTATGDIAAGDPPSDLASSVPALSLPIPVGPALSDPTPDGFPPSTDDHFLPPPGWLESPDPSLQIVAASASPTSVVAASESSSDVVVPATLQSQSDPVFSAPLSYPSQLHCDVDPVSALVHFCSTPSPVPSLSPAPTLDATASPEPQESVVTETVERLSAVAHNSELRTLIIRKLRVEFCLPIIRKVK